MPDVRAFHNLTLTANDKPSARSAASWRSGWSEHSSPRQRSPSGRTPASTHGGGYALVQLTPAATCVETVPLLEAGATPVAPSLRVFRLPVATARRLAPGLRARGALQTIELDRPLAVGVGAATSSPTRSSRTEWWRAVIGIDGLTPPGPGKPVTIVDSGIDLQHPEFLDRPDTVALNPQEPVPFGGRARDGGRVARRRPAERRRHRRCLSAGGDPLVGHGARPGNEHRRLRGGPRHHGRRRRRPGRDQPQPRQHGAGRSDRAGDRRGVRKGLARRRRGRERRRPAATRPTIPPTTPTSSRWRRRAVTTRSPSFSSRSPYVDLAAPGQDVTVATASDSSWQAESGTSFSTRSCPVPQPGSGRCGPSSTTRSSSR